MASPEPVTYSDLTQENGVVINHTQAIVLSFFGIVWIALIVILIATPDVYDGALKLSGSGRRVGELGFLVTISAFIAVLSFGVVRRWRWVFWLIVVAFLAGAIRVPASVLEIAGVLSATGPTWYVLFQTFLGIVQFAIGLAMFAGYRRGGVWGEP